ncbi:MAG: hypothetical protein C5B50_10315 [Verrucomicrobia bacterium]|nr:MAG: hypothetical protein C5B50_10315 [Verrucomicrobiota bacterium]
MNTDQTPNTKHQTPKKHQAPNIKDRRGSALRFGFWSLVFGVCQGGVWCLVFGVSQALRVVANG